MMSSNLSNLFVRCVCECDSRTDVMPFKFAQGLFFDYFSIC